jgi:hypothetical protein
VYIHSSTKISHIYRDHVPATKSILALSFFIFVIMGKKKPNNTKRNRNSGSKDATAQLLLPLQQQKSDLIVIDDASSSLSRISVVKTSSADIIGDNVDLEDVTPSTTSSTSTPTNIVAVTAVAGVNDVVIEKHANSSDDAPVTSSSSETQLAPLTDDTSLFLGNPSIEMKDDRYVSETIIDGAQRGDANDSIAIQQPSNNNTIAEQQHHQHVNQGAVVYNNEGEEEEERNNSVEGGVTTTTKTADDTKRVHWRSSTSLVDVISSFSEDEDPQTARRDKSVTINEDVALDIDAEAILSNNNNNSNNNNTMSEQWITKLIRILLARSCCYKVVRHDSTTPR